MKKYPYILFCFFILFTIGTARADLSILPFTKDSFEEIKKQRQNKPFVLIFWSETCGYCLRELAMFGMLYKKYPDVELVIVATDSFLEEKIVRDVLTRSQLDLSQTWVFAEQFPEKIYYKVNKSWRGELPATHFFGKDNKEIRHIGIVKEDDLIEWLVEQSTS